MYRVLLFYGDEFCYEEEVSILTLSLLIYTIDLMEQVTVYMESEELCNIDGGQLFRLRFKRTRWSRYSPVSP